jgi:hypothetical protein
VHPYGCAGERRNDSSSSMRGHLSNNHQNEYHVPADNSPEEFVPTEVARYVVPTAASVRIEPNASADSSRLQTWSAIPIVLVAEF